MLTTVQNCAHTVMSLCALDAHLITGGHDAASGTEASRERRAGRSWSPTPLAWLFSQGALCRATGQLLMSAAAMVVPSIVTWAGAVCVVAVMLPRVLRSIPPILRELRYNRVMRTIAKTDLTKPGILKTVADLILKHEECARDIECRQNVSCRSAVNHDQKGGDDTDPPELRSVTEHRNPRRR